jgi:hypothetical protein
MIKKYQKLIHTLLLDFDASAYHQYDNFTGEDFEIDYEELLKEYYEGQTIGSASNPRGQSNRLRANTGSPQVQERTSVQDKEFIQRFIQLKYSILFLQKTKKFGRYCFYGEFISKYLNIFVQEPDDNYHCNLCTKLRKLIFYQI